MRSFRVHRSLSVSFMGEVPDLWAASLAAWPQWIFRRAVSGRPREPYRTEEPGKANGPADYALWLDGQVVGVIEAKKITRST